MSRGRASAAPGTPREGRRSRRPAAAAQAAGVSLSPTDA